MPRLDSRLTVFLSPEGGGPEQAVMVSVLPNRCNRMEWPVTLIWDLPVPDKLVVLTDLTVFLVGGHTLCYK